MLKILLVFLYSFVGYATVVAQPGFVFSGKIKVLDSTIIKVESIDGKVILSSSVAKDGTFSMGPREIVPDVYRVCFGDTKQLMYLTNTKVTVKGFYDSRNVENSSLDFTGIEKFYEILNWLPKELSAYQKTINPEVKGKLEGNMYSALAFIAGMLTYEPNRILLDCMSGEALKTLSGKWLQHRTDSLYHYSVGVPAFNFTFQDSRGKKVSLSDFRGKLVLVDFWASWCGPCRSEMKSLLPIYNELRGDDLEFISVSLDSKEANWRKMLEEEKLPWVMLWDEEGFVVGNKPSTIQRAYGFYSIPFIVLIDREGRVIGRDLRGEKVKEEIIKARR